MCRTVELRESVYDRLVEAARAEGLPPDAWIESKLPAVSATAPGETAQREEARARLARFAGAVRVGHPHGADNDLIDADLARQYGDNHEPS
jgi:hypothetical protein